MYSMIAKPTTMLNTPPLSIDVSQIPWSIPCVRKSTGFQKTSHTPMPRANHAAPLCSKCLIFAPYGWKKLWISRPPGIKSNVIWIG